MSVHMLLNVLEVRQPRVHGHYQSQGVSRGSVLLLLCFNNFAVVLVPSCYILAWF